MAITLVVEDGTGKSTANTYQTVANANTRLEEIYPLMGLSAAPTIGNDVSMTSGTQYIDVLYGSLLYGIRSNEDQALEFPRTYVPKDEEKEYYYDSDELPETLLLAHAIACYYAENDASNLMPDQSDPGTIKREKSKIGALEEEIEYIGGKSQYKKYTLIDSYMNKLLDSSGGSGFAQRV